jgi:hypothetical protein
VVHLSLSDLLGIIYLAAAVPAVSGVVRPTQRSGAIGPMSAIGYLRGRAAVRGDSRDRLT